MSQALLCFSFNYLLVSIFNCFHSSSQSLNSLSAVRQLLFIYRISFSSKVAFVFSIKLMRCDFIFFRVKLGYNIFRSSHILALPLLGVCHPRDLKASFTIKFSTIDSSSDSVTESCFGFYLVLVYFYFANPISLFCFFNSLDDLFKAFFVNLSVDLFLAYDFDLALGLAISSLYLGN